MWQQPLWMISVGHLMGIAALVLGISLMATGAESLWWLALTVPAYMAMSLGVSVGLHRYFSHGSFKTTPFWHETMAWMSVYLLSGSALGWSTAHITHHVHSDTDRDVHHASWDYLLWKRYRDVPMVRHRLQRLISDPTLVALHRDGALFWVVSVWSAAMLFPDAVLFGYLMPLGLVHLIGGLHQVFTHFGGRPHDWPVMEYLLPACGEWMHATHHEHWNRADYRTRWWHLDLGFLFIRAIRTN